MQENGNCLLAHIEAFADLSEAQTLGPKLGRKLATLHVRSGTKMAAVRHVDRLRVGKRRHQLVSRSPWREQAEVIAGMELAQTRTRRRAKKDPIVLPIGKRGPAVRGLLRTVGPVDAGARGMPGRESVSPRHAFRYFLDQLFLAASEDVGQAAPWANDSPAEVFFLSPTVVATFRTNRRNVH
jgi:hypothetical protein